MISTLWRQITLELYVCHINENNKHIMLNLSVYLVKRQHRSLKGGQKLHAHSTVEVRIRITLDLGYH